MQKRRRPVTDSVTRFGEKSTLLPHLKAFGYFRNLHLALCNSLNLLWHIFDAIGKIFIYVSGQILTNNLATLVMDKMSIKHQTF